MIRYPNIVGKNDTQKLEQMKSYLHQLADELNYQLDKTSNAIAVASNAASAKTTTKQEEAISNFNDIKALIIKSADIVEAYSEEISKTLNGKYVSVSDFGTYKVETQAQLTASSDQIKTVVEKQEEIETNLDDPESEFRREISSEIQQTADSIKLEVTNETDGKTASITLSVGDNVYPYTIDMTGLVSFENLSEEGGPTIINGGNIKTGKINADLITAGTLRADVVRTQDSPDDRLYFSTLDELNSFVLNAATEMEINTRKTIGATFDGCFDNMCIGLDGFGSLEISTGRDGNGFKRATAVVTVEERTAYNDIWSEGWDENEQWEMILGLWVFSRPTLVSYTPGTESWNGVECYYRTCPDPYSGDDEIEWVNPPMMPGVEYRTTKRYNGKPVYVLRVTRDSLPNKGTWEFGRHYAGSEDNIISLTAKAWVANDWNPFPVYMSYGLAANMWCNASWIYVRTYGDMSQYKAEAIIEYIKT